MDGRELDGAVFARVWGRVAPGEGCPVEALPPAPPAAEGPGDGPRLLALVRGCGEDAAHYRALARMGRARGPLLALAERKSAQARRLGAAYFLLTGVYPRLWGSSAPRREGYHPLLRRQFWRERRRLEELEALARTARDGEVAALCETMAEESREALRVLRGLAEG